MAVVGVISRDPRLSLAEWLSCINQQETLVRPEPRPIVNPFTRAHEIYEPSPGEVKIRINGSTIGAIEPCSEFEDNGELDVYARDKHLEEVRKVAAEIARHLGAKLDWFGDD